ncbi:MAG: outer membrane beta-barrel protein [Bryobacteraceae bacterium]
MSFVSHRSKKEADWNDGHAIAISQRMSLTFRLPLVAAFTFGAALSSYAQAVSIGVKGGVPITDAFETTKGNSAAYATNTKRYIVGPTVQFNLPARFSIEIDALYKRLGYQYDQSLTNQTVYAKTVANSWEFPALIKFAILPGPVTPFVSVGGSVRHISGIKQIRDTVNAGLAPVRVEVNSATEFNKRNDVGAVFAGGLEFKIGHVRVTPELRYTRWGSENFRDPINALLHTNRNQGDFLMGFSF